MLRNLNSLLVALALLVAPAVARSEEPTKSYPDCGREPTDAEVAAAKGAFQAGNASFNEADYARAIDYWEDAYRRDCTANPLLLNLARAYELAGRKRQAVVSLETFLAREPNTGEKDQINRRIEVLKKKIAEEDAVAAAAAPTTGGTTIATPAAESPAEAAPDATTVPAVKRSSGPWIVVGAGGVLTIAGTIGILVYKGRVNDLASQCDDPNTPTVVETRANCRTEIADKGNAARRTLNVSGVVTGVGVAAIAAGFIWWGVDNARVAKARQQGATRARLLPMLGPELAGLSLSGAF